MSNDGDDHTDEFVRECLDDWTARFLTNGLAYDDLERLKRRIDSWDQWCPEFRAVGDRHVELGEEALDRDAPESAGDHFVDAA
ncbi:MAG: hypothetical protein ABEJ28_06630, partial [Salinigranum sp.]